MSQQILWIDSETTGTDPKKHAVVSLGMILEIDNEPVEEFDLRLRPFAMDLVDMKALEINGLSREEIMQYPVAGPELRSAFERMPIQAGTKLVLAGYNISSDADFLFQLMKKCSMYYTAHFHWPKIDVQTYVAQQFAQGEVCVNAKLGTVCEKFGVHLGQAHSALDDIRATRQLYHLLKNNVYVTQRRYDDYPAKANI